MKTSLIQKIRRGDKRLKYPKSIFTLAIDFGPKWYVRLCGWILAKDGKQYQLIDPRGADLPFHAVPSDNLLSMPSLRELMNL